MSKQPIIFEGKKVCVVSNGCPENRLDVARAEKYFAENGWQITKNWEEANLILFNACGRSVENESHSLNIIREIESKKKTDQQLVVWGCLPKIDPETLKNQYSGLISAGSELKELEQMLKFPVGIDQVHANNLGSIWPVNKKNSQRLTRYEGSLFSQLLKKPVLRWENYTDSRFNLVRNKDPSIFYIKISTGCRSNCAYCAIRKSRGLTKSKSIERVMDEFNEGLAKGFKKFSLMGTDLGSYGVDIGVNLVDLLDQMVKVKGDFKISLRNLHPHHLKDMIDDFCEVLASGKIQYLETAAESGNNRILRLMNRNYSIEEYKELVGRLRSAAPNLIIRTQLIAGFPTETEEEFMDSMRLLDDVVFDFVEVYPFSARPGTIAEKLEPKVPEEVKHQRFIRLYKKAVLNQTRRKVANIVMNRI